MKDVTTIHPTKSATRRNSPRGWLMKVVERERNMSQTVGYTVEVQGWPASAEANPLSVEQIYELLENDEFDQHHDHAVDRLAHVGTPTDTNPDR